MTTTPGPTPRRVSIRKAAAYSGLDERTIRRLINEGVIPCYRAGEKIFRIDLDEMDAALRIT